MKLQNKNSRALRKAMAFVMAAALAVSSLAAPSAEAASKKKPKLSAKKKTLYVSGKKTYTLKVKKNKVKKIKKVTWKTSNKKIVKLSKKKKMSVKLTAKKKGTATVKAVVTYGKNKKVTLKCKVTVKKKKSSSGDDTTPTQAPGTSDTPTQAPDSSDTPTQAPATVASVSLSAVQAYVSTAKDINTTSLKAYALDADGKEVAGQTFTWASKDTSIATVDANGLVTGVKEGTTEVTATTGSLSASCAVTVDAKAPTVEKAEVTHFDTITVTFNEAVKEADKDKNPLKVSVKKRFDASDVPMEPKLAEDGKSLTLTSATALKGNETYDMVINGLADQAGNPMTKDTKTNAIKNASEIRNFECLTTVAPAWIKGDFRFNDGIKIFFDVIDQYEEHNPDGITTIKDVVTASAKLTSGYTIQATVADGKDATQGAFYLALKADNPENVLTAGKVVNIGLTATYNKVPYPSTFDVTLENSKDVLGVPSSIKSVEASTTAGNLEEKSEGVFTFKNTAAATGDSVIQLKATVVDRFGYIVSALGSQYGVKFISENANILFVNDADLDGIVDATVKTSGICNVKAFLTNNDNINVTKTITINPAPVEKPRVNDSGFKNAYNGAVAEATLKWDGGAGLTAKDFTAEVTAGKELLDGDIAFVDGTENNAPVVKIQIKTKANGATNNTVKFKIVVGTVKGDEQTYVSHRDDKISKIEITPFKTYDLRVNKTASTTYKIVNAYGEDLTKILANDLKYSVAAQDNVIKDVVLNGGTMTVTAGSNTSTATIAVWSNSTPAIRTTIDVTVYATPAIAGLQLGSSSVDVIEGDSEETDLIKINKVTLSAIDQLGESFKMTVGEFYTNVNTNVAAMGLKIQFYKEETVDNKKVDTLIEVAEGKEKTDTTEFTKIGFVTATTGTETFGSTRTVKFTSSATPAKFNDVSITANVTKRRVATTLKFEKATKAVILDNAVENYLTVEDQYNTVMDNETVIINAADGISSTVGTYEKDKGYKVTVNPSATVKAGKYTITAYVDLDNDTKLSAGDPSGTFTLNTGDEHDLIKDVDINSTVDKHDLSKYSLKIAENSKTKDVDVDWIAYDENKDVIEGVNQTSNFVSWSAKATLDGATADIAKNTGVITTKASKASVTGTIAITLSCDSLDIQKTLTINASNAASAPIADTYKITYPGTDGKDVDAKNGKINLKAADTMTLTVTATDQYGDSMPITPENVVTKGKNVVTVATPTDNTITVTPASNVTVGASDVIVVRINSTLKYEITATITK